MDKDTTEVVATVETPSFLRRIPVKKVAIVTIVVTGALLLAKYAKDNVDVDTVVAPDVTV